MEWNGREAFVKKERKCRHDWTWPMVYEPHDMHEHDTDQFIYIELLFYFIFSSLYQNGIRLLCSALKVVNVLDIWQLNNSIQHTILIMKYSSI